MFTGREYDPETGLYYYRARMYSSSLGRFLQPDPIGYYDSMNLYQYCGNNPVNYIDPFGLCKESWWDKLKKWYKKETSEEEKKRKQEEWKKKSLLEKLTEAAWNLAPTGGAPFPEKDKK